ncbi:MAG TPA: flagellar export chaperone FliS [Planctomycetota bacterium]|nr:flagellar export chaperone FliS [Planctomycetota bacterium]
MTQQAAAAYRRNAILTASPGKLVKMLYDAALANLDKAHREVSDAATRRGAAAGEAISKSYAIVGELRAALDFEVGGKIARDLDALYDYCLEQITAANAAREPQGLDNARRVLRTLKEAWDVVLTG